MVRLKNATFHRPRLALKGRGAITEKYNMKISNLINDEVQNKWSRYMKKVYSLASENRVAYVIVH